ncbi:hypothetical protein GCM10010346_29770 [Streptomyces chryseus]|uniref:Uncharacterized protein n=1 Tax=Streptomyces chryseus TaxID=68186 RepID=A0ABQ3DN87_9ACTN|nr:hypothetical protein GCM10010346_29770 [Streptomyces chryseus]
MPGNAHTAQGEAAAAAVRVLRETLNGLCPTETQVTRKDGLPYHRALGILPPVRERRPHEILDPWRAA